MVIFNFLRSTSVDHHHANQVFSASQPSVLSTQSNNPRVSSIGGIGRASSIGPRQSSLMPKSGDKLINLQDLASSIAIVT